MSAVRDPVPPRSPRSLGAALVAVTLGLGAACALAAARSESMNADGMNYLDIADAYLRGDLDTAINPVWSPLYPWLLAAAKVLVRPSLRGEFALVHGVNFLVFAVALASFLWFWRQVERSATGLAASSPAAATFSPASWSIMGFALFTWSSLALIELWSVTPDLCVAAALYAAAGLLARARRGTGGGWESVALGIVLGLGYLAKAAVFPIAFVVLALAAVAGALSPRARSPLRGALGAVPALLAFVAVGGPFLAVLSVQQGGATFSDVGKVTYLKHVHHVTFPHYIPEFSPGLGEPDNPVRILHGDPTVYEFGEPVGGTYPLSFDPYHWFRGLDAPFDARRQLVALAVNLEHVSDLLLRRQGGVAATVLLLLAASVAVGLSRLRRAEWHWELVLIACAATGMYLLVHVTPRYIAPYCVLFWGGLLSAVRLPATAASRKILAAGAVLIALFAGADLARSVWPEAANFLGVSRRTDVFSHDLPGRVPGQPPGALRWGSARPSVIAEALLERGLRPGDRVGYIGNSFDAYWGHLVGGRIVAEIVPGEAERFWHADGATRDAALDAFRRAGATAVISRAAPVDGLPAGWLAVGETGYVLLRLEPGDPD